MQHEIQQEQEVIGVADLRQTYLLLVYGYPVSSGEPFVSFNIIDAVPEVSVPLSQVHLQQVSQQVLEICAEVAREPYLKYQIQNSVHTYSNQQSMQSELTLKSETRI